MARVRVMLEDDAGQSIGQVRERVYPLAVGSGTLAEIEGAVEHFKQEALVELEAELLHAAQRERMAEEKKEGG